MCEDQDGISVEGPSKYMEEERIAATTAHPARNARGVGGVPQGRAQNHSVLLGLLATRTTQQQRRGRHGAPVCKEEHGEDADESSGTGALRTRARRHGQAERD